MKWKRNKAEGIMLGRHMFFYFWFLIFFNSLMTIQSIVDEVIHSVIGNPKMDDWGYKSCLFLFHDRRRRCWTDRCSFLKKLFEISFWCCLEANAASSLDFEWKNSEVFSSDKSWRWPFSNNQTVTTFRYAWVWVYLSHHLIFIVVKICFIWFSFFSLEKFKVKI